MRKILLAALIVAMMIVSGCRKSSDLYEPTQDNAPNMPVVTPIPMETNEPEEITSTIHLSQTLKMTNDWTIIGDYDISLTGGKAYDRVVLATSAKTKNGQVMWDDSQYWTLAVLNENGAYNLFSQRMSGQVYIEVGEAYINGLATPIVTAYIFSGADREIRNYRFVEDYFEETIVYSTKEFSTGGVNSMYSTLPESDPR